MTLFRVHASWPLLYLASTLSLLAMVGHSGVGHAAEPVDPLNPSLVYGQQVKYAVFRNNKKIGSHTVDFSRNGELLEVAVESKLVVRIMKIPVYRFNYRASEQWQNGQLQSVDATVKEKGESSTVSLRRVGPQMNLTAKDGSSSMEQIEFASNHWHAGVLESDILFNTLTGKSNKIDIDIVGEEVLVVDGSDTNTTHYRYSGELDTEVWYDDRKRWVKLRFKGSDGSTIEYRCEGFSPA